MRFWKNSHHWCEKVWGIRPSGYAADTQDRGNKRTRPGLKPWATKPKPAEATDLVGNNGWLNDAE